MLSGSVTSRYTKGLFSLAAEKGIVDAVDQSLALVAQTIETNPELKTFLEHPLVKADAKANVLQTVFGAELHSDVAKFLKVLFHRGRAAYVVDVARRFHELADEQKGVVTVHIESATPLGKEQETSILARLSMTLSKQAKAEVSVNPDLIAGYRIRVGNRVLDATIKGALEQFREGLTVGGASKEGTR